MGGFDTSWLESLITTTAGAYSTVKNADALKSQNAHGDNGEFPVNAINTTGQGGTVLLIGAALLLVLFLKD